LLTFTSTGCTEPTAIESKPIDKDNTFVVLMEMNDFPEGYSDLPVDFINSKQLITMFSDLGIPEENMLIKQDEMSLEDLTASFEWIEDTVPENATVFFYIAAHGTYVRNELIWNSFVPDKWNSLVQENKILVLDSCMAGEFIETFSDESTSGITYGVTSSDEFGWWGVEEEGLPIIGSIWVHYFVEGVMNPESDINSDGDITFTEAVEFASPLVQSYMAEEVFTVEEFLSSYQQSGFDPLMKVAYPTPVFNNHLDNEIILNTIN
jgi:hypothetical protein